MFPILNLEYKSFIYNFRSSFEAEVAGLETTMRMGKNNRKKIIHIKILYGY
ncbi:hypothetical protein Hanom_Chr13g01227571 [Helianthus anomalus]